MPANKYAAIRYKIIHSMLSKKYPDYPSKEDLRQACEDVLYGSLGENISVSTIEKDLFAMRNETTLGYEAPIEYSKEHKGYYYTDPNYTLETLPLNEEDLEALQFAAGILQQFKGMQVYEQFSEAVDKISDVIDITGALKEETSESAIIQFERAPYFKGAELLSELALCIKNKKVVKLKHLAFYRKEEREHVLHPYLLKEFRNRWYVIGWHDEKEDIITFGLDRISEINVLNGVAYRDNSDFDPEAFFQHVFGISITNEAPIKAVLSFTPAQGKYLKTQALHHTQKIVRDSEEELVVSYEVVPNYEFVNRILGFGSDVKVVSPDSLVATVSKRIGEMAAHYS